MKEGHFSKACRLKANKFSTVLAVMGHGNYWATGNFDVHDKMPREQQQ